MIMRRIPRRIPLTRPTIPSTQPRPEPSTRSHSTCSTIVNNEYRRRDARLLDRKSTLTCAQPREEGRVFIAPAPEDDKRVRTSRTTDNHLSVRRKPHHTILGFRVFVPMPETEAADFAPPKDESDFTAPALGFKGSSTISILGSCSIPILILRLRPRSNTIFDYALIPAFDLASQRAPPCGLSNARERT